MLEVLDARTTTVDSPRSAASLPASPSTLNIAVYSLTIFLSAALLFQVQLIFAKHILPFFGGVPSVWNTCMFSFQVLLLLGYGYAHLLRTRFTLHQQRLLHTSLLLVSAILLVALWFHWGTPLTPGANWRPGFKDSPVTKILQLVAVTTAFPFFMLSTTGPLLQSWAARTSLLCSPYRLYALSNAGSLVGLLTYPFLLEWALTVTHQAWLWSFSYLLFVAVCLATVLRLPRNAAEPQPAPTRTASPSARPGPMRYALWLTFSTCSTVILLSSTSFIGENIAPIPLLWVLPLSLYLVTFMLAFDGDRWYSRRVFWPLYAAAVGIVMSANVHANELPPSLLILWYCLAIFAVCIVCHGELARSKPPSEHLTSFYWTVAAGGALGGTFVVLIAPRIFHGFWEFQGALLGCGVLLFLSFALEDRTGRSESSAWTSVLVLLAAFLLPHTAFMLPKLRRLTFLSHEYWTVPLCLGLWAIWRAVLRRPASAGSTAEREPGDIARSSLRFAWQPVAALLMIGLFAIIFITYVVLGRSQIMYSERNFFGVKYVREDRDNIAFISGNTIHGLQLKDPAQRYLPTMYFAPQSGIGRLLSSYPRNAHNGQLRVGVVGLGVGTLASYFHPGDFLRFYEIDPAVLSMSLPPRPLFSFLQHSPARIEIAMGDGRLWLERELAAGQPQQFDVLVLDAFNSDSVPIHLLTQEAISIYLRHLRGTQSVLAFNITNRFLDLLPVLQGAAQTRHLTIVEVRYGISRWVLLSADPAALDLPGVREVAISPATDRAAIFWTDNYSNIFQVFRHTRH